LSWLTGAESVITPGVYGRVKELLGTSAEADFKAARWLNWPSDLAFGGKLVCVAVAYYYLLRYLIERFV
jgi:hypothetical protein